MIVVALSTNGEIHLLTIILSSIYLWGIAPDQSYVRLIPSEICAARLEISNKLSKGPNTLNVRVELDNIIAYVSVIHGAGNISDTFYITIPGYGINQKQIVLEENQYTSIEICDFIGA